METTKKISLRSLKEKMSDNSLKHIMAGYGDGEVIIYAYGTCAWQGYLNGVLTVVCGLSLNAVKGYIAQSGVVHWCCDSCSSASWYDCPN